METDDLQRSFPAQIILSFSDSMTKTNMHKIIRNSSEDKLKAKIWCELSLLAYI